MTKPRISDVARRAGVSVGTVSNVINRPQAVQEATRIRVEQAIAELGYVRNASARQLREGSSRAVGLVILDANPFNTEVARGVEDTVKSAGNVVIVCNSASSSDNEHRNLKLLEEQGIDKLLITPVAKPVPPELERLRARGVSVVLLDYPTRRRDICSVAVDDLAGGRLAGEHLVAIGHRRLALINGRRSNPALANRSRGFVSSVERHGLSLARGYDVECEHTSVPAGEAAGGALLDRRQPPTAVFCGNDLVAIGVLRAAMARGLSIPDDLAIVGYDDLIFAELSAVPLTSVRQPNYELGRRGAELLLEEARDGVHHEHERIVFTPELVARQSTLGRTPQPTRRRAA